ncbi:MAG: hypothetical protein KAG96_06415 [Ichthyobacteriaceae bacterium]|nr:hypothetical protein [Ichthyobacteriaceae bacterium]
MKQLNEILQNNKVKLWYPSSGLDFRDLVVLSQKKFIYDKYAFANELLTFNELPNLFIHTDTAYTSENWPLPNKGVIFEDEEQLYKILESKWVSENNNKVGVLLNMEIQHKLINEPTNQNLLFLFTDNITFFENHILKDNINIQFLINIRDGFSENGGADFSMKFLEFYLGKMNTEYLITDNIGRVPQTGIIMNSTYLKSVLNSIENNPVSLQGLKEWSWSEFGIFAGDAILMKVHSVL